MNKSFDRGSKLGRARLLAQCLFSIARYAPCCSFVSAGSSNGIPPTTWFSRYPALWTLIVLCGLVTFVSPVQAAEPTGQVVVAWPGRMQHVSVARDRDGKAVFADTRTASQPGQPAVPCRTVEILLPPDAVPRTVTVAIRNAVVEDIAGEWDVPPVPAVAIGAPPQPTDLAAGPPHCGRPGRGHLCYGCIRS